MDIQRIKELKEEFESYSHQTDQEGTVIEFWFARELQKLFGYKEWRNFKKVLGKAIESVKKASESATDHFVEVNKTSPMPNGGTKNVEELMLTRYACYLVAQNADPSKEAVAFAQNYFAVQTRKIELIQERIEASERLDIRQQLKEEALSAHIYERGVDNQGFGRIRSKGDQAFFGGLSTGEMKVKLNVPKGRALADFLPTISITAKKLATELTNLNTKRNDLYGEAAITEEHIQNNQSVRDLLISRGVKPEELPAAEDIKKLERRVKAGDKKALKEIQRLDRGKK